MDKSATLLIKAMWADAFKLPLNDERLLALTPREALEQVFAMEAFAQRRAEAIKRARGAARTWERDAPPQSEVHRDESAKKLADTPHLTGDPEWDAIELAETDPSKPPLTMKVE